MYVPGVHGGQERASDSPELQLQIVPKAPPRVASQSNSTTKFTEHIGAVCGVTDEQGDSSASLQDMTWA